MFRVSISSAERTALLNKATGLESSLSAIPWNRFLNVKTRMLLGLLYTPDREHFGIVPLEAMYQQCPVIAVNSGGPKETILHGLTGYLCPQVS